MERDERHKARELASQIRGSARPLTLRETYSHIYEVDGSGCYFEGGDLQHILPLLPKAILPVRPYESEADLVRATGFTANQLAERHREGIIEVTVQSLERFADKDFFDPLLRLRPKNHIVRGNLSLAVFLGDEIDYLDKDGIECSPRIQEIYDISLLDPLVRESADERFVQAREPYQRSTYGPRKRATLIDSFAWKMTYAKIIFGSDVVEDLRRMMPSDVFLSLLTSIHLDFEHPFTHGGGRSRAICGRDIFERHELDVGPEWLQDVRLSYRGYERVPDDFCLPIPSHGGTDIDFTLKMRHESSLSALWPVLTSAASHGNPFPWEAANEIKDAVAGEAERFSSRIRWGTKVRATLASVGTIAGVGGLVNAEYTSHVGPIITSGTFTASVAAGAIWRFVESCAVQRAGERIASTIWGIEHDAPQPS